MHQISFGGRLVKKSITWIITINYRTSDLVIESLRTLASQSTALGGGKVFVVDNASGDDSGEKILQAIQLENWSSWVSFVQAERNGGFAFGNNIGFTQALSSPKHVDYMMLLNPDSLAREGAIEKLVNFMDQNPLVGIASGKY
jgi:N-acetylglucosaminyl-diphospho-decaprenol L-rhamnosyltransferase